MGSQVAMSLAMNRLMYCNRPKKLLISFSLLGGGISNMALILDGSTSIPLSLTRKPSNFLAITSKVQKSVASRSLKGSSTCGRLGLEGPLLFLYSNFIL